MKTISVLGAGFIGCNLIKHLLKKDIAIRVLSRGKQKISGVEWIQSNLSNKIAVRDTIKNSDVVYHLISSTVPGDEVNVSNELFCNVSEMIQLLDLCVEYKIKRIVFISSASVYGPQNILPIVENSILNPISTHGIQKLTLEYYLKFYNYQYGLNSKILRLSNPYGPGQDLLGRQGFISIILGNILNNKKTIIRGNGEIVRDFIFIEDVVEACIIAGNVDTDYTVFNIGSGKGYSLNEILHLIRKIIKVQVPVEYTVSRSVDINKSILSIEKAKKELKFTPRVSIEEGLKKFIKINNII